MFIKFIFGDRKRKTKSIPTNLKELRELALKLWGENVANLAIGYVDSENELINIVNDDDWALCLEEFEEMKQETKRSTLTLHILDSQIEYTPEYIIQEEGRLETEESIVESKVIESQPNTSGLVHIRRSAPEGAELLDSTEGFRMIEDENEMKEERVEQLETQATEEAQENIKEENEPESIFETEEKEPEMEEEEPVITEAPQDDFIPQTRTLPNGDIIIDYKLKTTNPEQVQETLRRLGPMLGIDLVSSEIVDERDIRVPKAPQEQDELELDSLTQRSSMSQDMRSEIEGMIEERVQRQVNEALSRSGLETGAQTQRTTQANSTAHTGVTCDGCRVHPITGIRFKSLVNPDYDLCEACEAKGEHEGPMVRFRKPAPFNGMKMEKMVHKFKRFTEGAQNGGGCRFGGWGRKTGHNPWGRWASTNTNTNTGANNANNGNPLQHLIQQAGQFLGQGQNRPQGQSPPLQHLIQQAGQFLNQMNPQNRQQAPQQPAQPQQPQQQPARGRTGPGLVHIRSTQQQPTQSDRLPHARLVEFQGIFPQVPTDKINDFLYEHDGLNDDTQLFNLFINRFI